MGTLPYPGDQLIDAAMAHTLHAGACRNHAAVAWVVLWDLPAYPSQVAAQQNLAAEGAPDASTVYASEDAPKAAPTVARLAWIYPSSVQIHPFLSSKRLSVAASWHCGQPGPARRRRATWWSWARWMARMELTDDTGVASR
jgi:hypothetical protein